MIRDQAPTLLNRQRRLVPRPSALQGVPGERPHSLNIWRDGRVTTLKLGEGIRYVVGRHDAADVVFEDAGVSRLHGVLCFDDGEWWFEDYGSSNGTLLYALRDDERALLPHAPERVVSGDVLHLGTERCRLELSRDHPRDDDKDHETVASAAARELARRIELASKTRVPVFLLGPSGAGKTWAAQQIHQVSAADGPLVPINCARLPRDSGALHSELLGHVKGAFTGADSPRTGRLLLADGGTLFLDEVESLSELAQGFLLDVLEGTGDLSPLGAKSPTLRTPIFRLVSASKRPLGESGLRPDLCERLAEGHMWRLPTLDERREDIPGLVRLFVRQQEALLGVNVDITDDALALACEAPWPGQIRQLRATIVALLQLQLAERALEGSKASRLLLRRSALASHLEERKEAWGSRPLSHTIAPGALSASTTTLKATSPPVRGDSRKLSRAQVLQALQATSGNQSEAARRLGVARNTLARKMKSYGIEMRIG